MFYLLSVVYTKMFYIKHFGSEQYMTGSFDPISLPMFGSKEEGHLYMLAHPENDAKITIIKLACVPNMKVIPKVVLDATDVQDKLTYFSYNDRLKNEQFEIIRYEEGVLIVRDGNCLTYNKPKQFFYTMRCIPRDEEQLFEIVEGFCSAVPEEIELDVFLQKKTVRK